MTLTTIILLVLALFMVQLFLQETSRFGFDVRCIVGNRDHLPDLSVIAGRLDRAKNNMLEALPLFLGLAMLALVKSGDNGDAVTDAAVFLAARVAYVPAYVSGLPWLRSIAWLTANGGLILMALTLFQGSVALSVVATALLHRWQRPPVGFEPIPFPFPLHNLALLGIRNTLIVFAVVGLWWIYLSAQRLLELNA